ncbi:single-stranded-DNA-specific exonuclease RecJ [Clostridium pasteurianum DSM 525 = ATCC 6013]|uniref:Phosphoesterase RecJ domain protein n=1 Tax=Clostridium pasteurianum DSM 525 = ATCC 6013 TaxID=1262449 RepID=A0A0H3J582_CLOPA|nr:DHH family phosphoesterase [Clostridium pasteurianum]AJA48292.1 single-stranded-DNA-specific exonuclease RecJ [Clostridium pasteurianum DSM 525 = ATCC 6013]AJA52280.1 single-stranded-DNA-specific exonuclease RecJ [Clostridium pasteurianum DSM 525 = ATCC 6013]AOZ75544.1 delta(24)-sterol C-methyltransferase [Clostridium pasteurianum DSM 525 = ATCC 6013]AOZ79339.1 delta(24)-sterol C-methyltransferase [Clostridium pasteurianum]ELP60558.1 N-terminal domain of SS-DNA-specific exonuclease RecJ [Cl
MEIIEENVHYLKQLKFHNPFFMDGMREAINRVLKAVNNKEKIIIYGYSDVDSISGISILFLLLKYLNADVEYFIPDYMDEEYRISSESLKEYIRYLGADLLITVGCGSNSKDEIMLAQDMGIDVIVTDYHEIYSDCEQAIIINPNKKLCKYPFKFLSAAGIAFKFCEAVSRYYKIKGVYKYIDLAMIGTISSKLPLEAENRTIVDIGLEHLAATNNYGIKALMKINNFKKIDQKAVIKLSQSVISAKSVVGRIDNARIAVELFTTHDSYRAFQIAKYLNKEILK